MQTPEPVPWIDSDRELPDLIASVPDDRSTDELPLDAILDATRVSVAAQSPTVLPLRADARDRFDAIPDMNQLVKREVDARSRLQKEVEAALNDAVRKLHPELQKKPTSPAAWLLLGLSLGGMLVFLLLGTQPVAAQTQAAAPMTIVSAAAPTPIGPAPVCVAPEIAPPTPVTLASTDGVFAIPTFAVDALPKPKPKPMWVAPVRHAAPTPAPTVEAESDNPYDDDTTP